MGWSIGWNSNLQRDVGYGVPAWCDHPGCNVEINRGLAYVCGSDAFGGDYGCGMHFCSIHRQHAGKARNHAELCQQCYRGRAPFDAKPDHPDWIRWKLTDESWARWRAENPDTVKELTIVLSVFAEVGNEPESSVK